MSFANEHARITGTSVGFCRTGGHFFLIAARSMAAGGLKRGGSIMSEADYFGAPGALLIGTKFLSVLMTARPTRRPR